jgi:hypothetical protein
MGLSLVGVGLVNLSTSDNGYGNAGDYNCDSLKDQSTLWMGVGVLVLTSFGLMASFWPGPRKDEFSTGHLSHRAQCCCRKAESPTLLENDVMEPLLTEEDGERQIERDGERQTIRDGAIMDDHEHATATNVEERNESTSRLRGTSRLLKLAGNQSLFLWVGIVVLLVRLPFSLIIPHFVSTTIASLISEDFSGARREVLLLFLLGTVDAVLDFWCVFLFGKAKENIVRAVRVDTFSSLMRQDQSFFDRTNTGDLISRLTSDCGEMAGDLTW